MLCSSTTLTFSSTAFFLLITCSPSLCSPVFILSAFASPALANLSSHTESHALVKAASLEFNTFLWHGRLGSHDRVVPWPLTRGAETILLSAPIGLCTVKQCSPAKCVHNSSGRKKPVTVEQPATYVKIITHNNSRAKYVPLEQRVCIKADFPISTPLQNSYCILYLISICNTDVEEAFTLGANCPLNLS